MARTTINSLVCHCRPFYALTDYPLVPLTNVGVHFSVGLPPEHEEFIDGDVQEPRREAGEAGEGEYTRCILRED